MLATPERIATATRPRQLVRVGSADILDAYVRHDMQYYGLSGGPVHDAAVIGYLLQPSLFSGHRSAWRSTAARGWGSGERWWTGLGD